MIKFHPILFSADMIRATLSGHKVMTRRIVKNHPADIYNWDEEEIDGINHAYQKSINEDTGKECGPEWLVLNSDGDYEGSLGQCRYGKVGDVLWVRETWKVGAWNDEDSKVAFDYKASPELIKTPWSHYSDTDKFDLLHQKLLKELDDLGIEPRVDEVHERIYYKWKPGNSPFRWRPCIHMPKEAARIWLKITAIRIERLHDISDKDAVSEGVETLGLYPGYNVSSKGKFEGLWGVINGVESWEANPWVWVIEFKVIDKPKNFN